MIISYWGGSAFRLQSGEKVLLINPPSNRLRGNVTLRSQCPTDTVQPVAGEISFGGEYEVEGIEITGFPLLGIDAKKVVRTAYLIKWEGVVVVHLTDANCFPDTHALEEMAECDILLCPGEATGQLTLENIGKLIKQLEPSIIIPSYAKTADGLLKLLGQKTVKTDKLVFKKKELTPKEMRVVLLEPANS